LKFEEGDHQVVSNWIKEITDYGMNSCIEWQFSGITLSGRIHWGIHGKWSLRVEVFASFFVSFLTRPKPPHFGQHWCFGFRIYPWSLQHGQITIPISQT